MLSRKTALLFALALAVPTVATVTFADQAFGGFAKWPADAAARAISVFTALLVVAVFLERVVAVILDLVLPQIPTAAGSTPTSNIEARLQRLFGENAKREQLGLLIGLALALVASLAGVRTLANLADELPTGIQLRIFSGIDAFLTAGLLTGGSAGIAAIIDFWKKRMLLLLKRLSKDADV